MNPGSSVPWRRSLFSQQSRPHHVLAVQVVQHGAEQVRARLVVGFAGVVVQLAAQLIGDQRQQDVPAVCGSRTDGDDGDLTPTCVRRGYLVLGGPPTWLPEQVALHHFAHAAHLLAHELRVGDALDELGQQDAAKTEGVESAEQVSFSSTFMSPTLSFGPSEWFCSSAPPHPPAPSPPSLDPTEDVPP